MFHKEFAAGGLRGRQNRVQERQIGINSGSFVVIPSSLEGFCNFKRIECFRSVAVFGPQGVRDFVAGNPKAERPEFAFRRGCDFRQSGEDCANGLVGYVLTNLPAQAANNKGLDDRIDLKHSLLVTNEPGLPFGRVVLGRVGTLRRHCRFALHDDREMARFGNQIRRRRARRRFLILVVQFGSFVRLQMVNRNADAMRRRLTVNNNAQKT